MIDSHPSERAAFVVSRVVRDLAESCPEVKRHCERVATLAGRLAHSLGLSDREVRDASIAGALHDLAKVNLDDGILKKGGHLNDHETHCVHEVPLHSASMARQFGFSTAVQRAIVQRHERPDGKGYPYGIADDRISLLAKIIAVADTFDSLTHDQPYRKALDPLDAIGVIRSKSRFQFDPQVVDQLTTITIPGSR